MTRSLDYAAVSDPTERSNQSINRADHSHIRTSQSQTTTSTKQAGTDSNVHPQLIVTLERSRTVVGMARVGTSHF